MIMPVASKRKTPASLEAVDATFSPTFFDESQKMLLRGPGKSAEKLP
jgi:hypothetical protein